MRESSRLMFIICLLLYATEGALLLGDPPSFRSEDFPRRIELLENKSLSLECKAQNADEVVWLKNGRELGTQGSHLHIESLLKENAGEYRCFAKNAMGSVLSPSIDVIVQYLEDFDTNSVNYQVSSADGGSFVLKRPKLIADSDRNVEFTWYQGDKIIDQDINHFVTQRGDLVVTDVSARDFGRYKVVASSPVGEAISAEYSVNNDPQAYSSEFSVISTLSKTDIVIQKADNPTAHVFDCASSARADSVHWFLDGPSVSGRNGVTLADQDRKITFSNPTAFHGIKPGKHQLLCKVSAGSGRLFSQHKIRLNIVDIPMIQNLRSEMHKPLGSSLVIACHVATTANIRWFKNGKEFPSSNGLLTIAAITEKDYGVYQCEAKNEAGSDLNSLNLKEGSDDQDEDDAPLFPFFSRDEKPSHHRSTLQKNVSLGSAPNFDVFPESTTIPKGIESYLIPCKASGNPKPSIIWKFNDDIIEMSTKYQPTPDGLLIHEPQRSDSGRYACVARNEHGTESELAQITVSGGGLIERGSTNQSMLIGTSLEVPCEVSSEFRGTAQISWFINGEEIPKAGNPGLRLSRNRKGGLVIAAVGPDSIGEYKCTVSVNGREESASMWLEIIEKPNMPTGVTAQLVNDSVPAKIRVTWNEGFDGNSPIIRYMIQMRTLGPTELWSDWEIVGESDPSENCCSYLLDNLRPSVTAQFRVTAANKHGPGKPSLPSVSVTMPQQPPAAAPKNVAASARSANSIIVQWQKPQDEQFSGDILGYLIRYRLSGYATLQWMEKNVTTRDARNAVIDQLITWQEYEIQVAAYNERGLGVFSKSIEVTTAEGVPTQAPKNVKANVLNSTAVEVSFDGPDQQRIPGVNLGYKIQFWKGSADSGHLHKQVLVDPNSRSITMIVEGLEKYGHYNLTVLCYTSPGDGPKSSPLLVITAQDVPGPVSGLTIQEVMYDGAFITWDQPLDPNGIIVKYTLRYWEDAAPQSKTRKELDGSARNATISGLQSITKHSLDISASTNIGDGPREETKFESGRPPVLPERPSSLSVSDIEARSVNLQFVPGHDGYTAIRQWIVEARVEESGVFNAVYNVSAPKARSLSVTGLRPYTRYQLRLIAENVKGRGAPSEPTRAFETKQTNPDTPASKLFAEPVSATSISLSWTPLLATQWNGQPKGYLILYRQKGSEDWQEMRTSSLRASDFVLRDLKPFIDYEVDLFAENMFGRSASAGMEVTRTYESSPSSAPSNIQATAEGMRSIAVKWDKIPEDSANGVVLGYKVRAVPETEWLQNDETKTIDVPGEDVLMTKITDLRPYTGYTIYVSAYTVVSKGPEGKASEVIRTDEDLPGPPTGVSFSLVSEDEVRLKWLPPEHPNGKIKSYSISYWPTSGGPSAAPAMKAPIPSSLGGFTATSLKPNTKYTFSITAETSIGVGPETRVEVITSSVRVPIHNPPVVVRDQRLKYSSTEIAIKWDHSSTQMDEDAPIRFIQVEYEKANDEVWTTFEKSISGDKSGITINRLSPNSAYRFRIRYVGDFAQSTWSSESEWMRTLPSAPSAPPMAIQSLPYDSNSLQLQWNSPPKASWNSDAVGYHINYREYPSNESWRSEDVPSQATHEDRETFVLTKLTSFRHYIVRMSTFNSEGESSFSHPVFVYVGYSIPKRKIQNLIAEPQTSSSISVRWDPWGNDEKVIISGFKVRFVPIASVLSEISHEEEIMAVENNSCIISDLRKFTEYQISVSAYNRAGEGESSTIRIRTLEDVPGPVANLRFVDVLLDSVKVIWDPPTQPNGIVTNYTVNYRTFKMLRDFKTEMQSRTPQLFFPATNLEEGSLYVFTVWAETAAGRGTEATANITIGPIKDVPAPTRVNAIPGPSSVTLTWKDPARDDIIGHLIQAKRIANESLSETPNSMRIRRSPGYEPAHILGKWTTLKTIDGTSQRHEISYRELEPSSSYVFRVFARTEKGVGQSSDDSDQLIAPASIPEDPFYMSWWFISLVAMSTLVVVVLVIAFLCVTGSNAKFKRNKRNSIDSLQLADGNFVTFQMKGNQRMNRSRNDLLMRPATTQSWLSEPPAYGSVLGVDREDSAGNGVNMYGHLATDIIPTTSQQGLERLSALVGRDVSGTGTAYVSGPYKRGSIDEQQSEYGRRSQYGNRSTVYSGYASRNDLTAKPSGEYEADSFDEEEESVQGDDRLDPPGVSSIVDHYGETDHYRDTWRRVRDTEVVRAPLPPGGGSTVSQSPAASSESTWPAQSAPQLVNGFSSFV